MSKKILVSKFIQFINDELNDHNGRSEEFVESLEVARQCLETAYEVDPSTLTQSTSPSLLELLNSSIPQPPDQGANTVFNVNDVPNREPTHEEKERADKLKTQGNSCMSQDKYLEAIECYSKAIEINPRNAVFYCNRAAAYSKRQDKQGHELAIKDCERALTIDPNYCKAYARMAFAYLESGNSTKAIQYYKKALEYEPHNESYQQQLAIAEAHARRPTANFPNNASASGTGAAGSGTNPSFPGLGNIDFSSFLNNPALMNMATQMLSSPQMQSMMSNLLSTATAAPGGAQGIDSFLQMGQQMASQMQQSNPEVVDMLRNRFNTPEYNPNNINIPKNDSDKDKQPPGDADKDHQQ